MTREEDRTLELIATMISILEKERSKGTTKLSVSKIIQLVNQTTDSKYPEAEIRRVIEKAVLEVTGPEVGSSLGPGMQISDIRWQGRGDLATSRVPLEDTMQLGGPYWPGRPGSQFGTGYN